MAAISSSKPVSDDELLAMIYAGVVEASPWVTFLTAVANRLGAKYAAIIFHRHGSNADPLAFWNLVPPGEGIWGSPDAAQQSVALGLCSPPCLNAGGNSGTCAKSQLPLDPYLAFAARYGISGVETRLLISQRNGWSCHLGMFGISVTDGDLATDLDWLGRLRDHLDTALSLFATIHDSALECQVLRRSIDRLSIGTALLDCTGLVLATNALTELLIEEGALVFRSARLHLPDVDRDRELQAGVKQVISGDCEYVAVTATDARGRLLNLLVRSASVQTICTGNLSSAILYANAGAAAHVSEPLLRKVFNFSISEAKVAASLTSGRNVSNTARHLNFTESTVRSYVKSIFAKAGVHRQADLVRVIASSIAVL